MILQFEQPVHGYGNYFTLLHCKHELSNSDVQQHEMDSQAVARVPCIMYNQQ